VGADKGVRVPTEGGKKGRELCHGRQLYIWAVFADAVVKCYGVHRDGKKMRDNVLDLVRLGRVKELGNRVGLGMNPRKGASGHSQQQFQRPGRRSSIHARMHFVKEHDAQELRN
jgi:hypothetical protein